MKWSIIRTCLNKTSSWISDLDETRVCQPIDHNIKLCKIILLHQMGRNEIPIPIQNF